MSDYHNRDRHLRYTVWFAAVAITLAVAMFCPSAKAADEWLELTVRVELHPDAMTVSRECTVRAERRGRRALSAMPSCFARNTAPGGGPCIVIARRPADLDDLAARDRIGAEVENCIAGHVIPVNPQ